MKDKNDELKLNPKTYINTALRTKLRLNIDDVENAFHFDMRLYTVSLFVSFLSFSCLWSDILMLLLLLFFSSFYSIVLNSVCFCCQCK